MMSELSDREMLPPWEVFPTYERYSLGWRMRGGEDYFHDWWDFIATLPDDYDTRMAYLSRHRPAPINWASLILIETRYNFWDRDDRNCRQSAKNCKMVKIQNCPSCPIENPNISTSSAALNMAGAA